MQEIALHVLVKARDGISVEVLVLFSDGSRKTVRSLVVMIGQTLSEPRFLILWFPSWKIRSNSRRNFASSWKG